MSFWKDLLGDLYFDPKSMPSKSMWSSLERETSTLNLEGVSGSSGEAPIAYAPQRTPSTEQLAAIIQRRERAFNIVEINPFYLTAENYRPQISMQRIFERVGYEADNYNSLVGSPYPFNNNNSPVYGWRCVEMPIAGTFVRFDFSPGQMNSYSEANIDNTSQEISKKYEYTTLVGQFDERNATYISSRNILVQIDDPSGPLIIMRPGDAIKIPFERIYVYCKYYVPKFSLTFGYNAEIVSANDNRILNSDPAFGGAQGIWEYNSRHCTPFSIGPKQNLRGKFGSNFSQISVFNNTSTSIQIFNQTGNVAGRSANPLTNNNQVLGAAVGWITGFQAMIVSDDDTKNLYGEIVCYLTLDNSGYRSTTDKVLFTVPFGIHNTDSTRNVHINRTWTHPIRFSLFNFNFTNEATDSKSILAIDIFNFSLGNGTLEVNFSLEGYVYGGITPYSAYNSTSTAGAYLEASTITPYPLDYRYPTSGM